MKRLLFSLPLAALLLALSCSAAFAQSEAAPAASNPPSPLAAPVQTSKAVDKALDPKLPTLFIVGDSTARNQADLGWGDHFAALFDTTRINVANRAVAGRSTRTFVSEGRWEKVVAELKPGDYVILQLGHNDGGNDADSPKSRASLKGIGNESIEVTGADGKVITVLTYGGYMRKFIADVRAKKATPILMTPTVRNIWTKGPDGNTHVEHDMGYGPNLRLVAADQKVQLAEMGGIEANVLEKLGPDRTAKLFPKDHTHTSAEGAEMNAKIAALSLVQIKAPVVNYLMPKALDNLMPAK